MRSYRIIIDEEGSTFASSSSDFFLINSLRTSPTNLKLTLNSALSASSPESTFPIMEYIKQLKRALSTAPT